MNLLNIGLSGVLATQHQMGTASNNISNATVEGYARQATRIQQASSVNNGGVLLGQGVYVGGVDRLASDYLEVALRDAGSNLSFYKSAHELGSEIDRVLSDQDSGLDKSLQSFFTSLGDLANNPTSEATRSVVLDSLEGVGMKLDNLNSVIDLGRDSSNKDLVSYANRLTQLSQELVKLNEGVLDSKSKNGQVAPELLDKRYQVLQEMAKIADISTHEGEDGIVSVFAGPGLAIVSTNNVASDVVAAPNEYGAGSYSVTIRGFDIRGHITGGAMGGIVEYQNSVLDVSEQHIGRIALSLGQMLNVTHREGYTPSGVPGGSMVGDFTTSGLASSKNTGAGSLAVSFDTSGPKAAQEALVGQLQSTDYTIKVTAGGVDVLDASGEQVLTGAPMSFVLDGLNFDLTGAVAVGDSFKVSPMKDALAGFDVQIASTADIANSQDPAGSTSDNRNSLALYDLQGAKVISGVDSFQSGYSTLVAKVGATVSTAEGESIAYAALQKNAFKNRESLSGVNIEEEAAIIMRLQDQYRANAKVVQVAQEVFDELLSVL